jgi:hypothetical protein
MLSTIILKSGSAKNKMARFLFFLLPFFFTSMILAESPEPSSPEFECTALQLRNRDRARLFLGKKKYPSIALQSYSSGNWLIRVAGEKTELSREAVVKEFNFAEKKISYRILYQNNIYRLDLSGKSPSRRGTLWELTNVQQPKLLAKVTCH